jgi:hypothetical protein
MVLPGANQQKGTKTTKFLSNQTSMCMVNDYCHPERKARESQIEMKQLGVRIQKTFRSI